MILWLASYTKSGNTWLRLLLTNYLFDNKKDVFQNLDYFTRFPRTSQFKDICKIKEKSLDIYKYFILAQDKINLNNKINFLKTHSINGKVNNFDFTNKANTAGFIYIVRDPRSVVISNAHHLDIKIDDAVKNIINQNMINYYNNLADFKSSWKIHYISWKKSIYPRIFIKYEDLHKNTFDTFKSVLEFIKKFNNLEIDNDKINNAIEKCHFENLQNHENQFGFKERIGKKNFFRKGSIDEWMNVLTNEQIKVIESEFDQEMRELQYL